jgi:hypothetical protein
MKDKIKIVLDVTSLFVAFGVVMLTSGMMFMGIADYSLKDKRRNHLLCYNVWHRLFKRLVDYSTRY